MTAVWRNWSRTVEARPARIVTPADESEVAAILARASAAGVRVKAVGSGHSFTPLAVTDGIQVRLDRLVGIEALTPDPSTGRAQVTVAAGTPLHVLNAALLARGYAMTNLGDIAEQTVAGAISSGTHGSGRDSAGLAAQVTGVRLVCADGSIVSASADREPDVFAAARLGLGALGVLTAVTFEVEPAFVLRSVTQPDIFDAVLERFDDLVAEEHVDLHWLPFTDAVQLKYHRRTDEPSRPLNRARSWWEHEVIENGGLGIVQRLTRAVPRSTPAVNQVAARLISRRDYTGQSAAVFTSIRRVRFDEMEYALPRGAAVAALRELRDLTTRGPWRVAFPVQVRLAPADDVWLSTAYGRDTVYVAVHAYPRTDYAGWFAAVEALWTSYGGRPHWGKRHTRDAAYLVAHYERFADFRRVRDVLDPHRTMNNEYVQRVLGD